MPDQPEAITEQGRRVATHWSRLAVTPEGARRALEARGIDPAAARPEDLHAVDMIHMGGLTATDTLAELAGIGPGQLVLDAGSGVGGPARRLASRFGARVTGVELSETLHRTAIDLTRLVGLEEKVRLLQGSILSLPFDDASFDAVILQHVAMQIAEKGRLFSELARVIRPGGCLALHEIFAGSPSSGPGELHYPLPWATDPGMSALETLPECRSRLAALGLAPGTSWTRARPAGASTPPASAPMTVPRGRVRWASAPRPCRRAAPPPSPRSATSPKACFGSA